MGSRIFSKIERKDDIMNLSTLIVLFIVIGIVSLSLRTMINDKKNGKSSCGGDCGGCGNPLLKIIKAENFINRFLLINHI